jgi:hypothetical protein
MSIEDQVGVRPLQSAEDLAGTRLEPTGIVFHGTVAPVNGNKTFGSGNTPMSIEDQVGVRPLQNAEDLAETRLEAIGFVFHGTVAPVNGNGKKPTAVKAGTNLLHFARCAKLDKAGDGEAKIWFRSVNIAKAHLDETVGVSRWKWCKVCEREITQKVLNER